MGLLACPQHGLLLAQNKRNEKKFNAHLDEFHHAAAYDALDLLAELVRSDLLPEEKLSEALAILNRAKTEV